MPSPRHTSHTLKVCVCTCLCVCVCHHSPYLISPSQQRVRHLTTEGKNDLPDGFCLFLAPSRLSLSPVFSSESQSVDAVWCFSFHLVAWIFILTPSLLCWTHACAVCVGSVNPLNYATLRPVQAHKQRCHGPQKAPSGCFPHICFTRIMWWNRVRIELSVWTKEADLWWINRLQILASFNPIHPAGSLSSEVCILTDPSHKGTVWIVFRIWPDQSTSFKEKEAELWEAPSWKLHVLVLAFKAFWTLHLAVGAGGFIFIHFFFLMLAFQAAPWEGGAGGRTHLGPGRDQDHIWQHPRDLRGSHQDKGRRSWAFTHLTS